MTAEWWLQAGRGLDRTSSWLGMNGNTIIQDGAKKNQVKATIILIAKSERKRKGKKKKQTKTNTRSGR